MIYMRKLTTATCTNNCLLCFALLFLCQAGNGGKHTYTYRLFNPGLKIRFALLCGGTGNGGKHIHTNTHTSGFIAHTQRFMMNDSLAHIHIYVYTAFIYIPNFFQATFPTKAALCLINTYASCSCSCSCDPSIVIYHF